VFGSSIATAAAILALALAAGFGGWVLSVRTHETTPAFPLQYAPPDGVGPAQAQYLLTERVGQESFVASVMHAADRGAVTLERHSDRWVITDGNGAAGWNGLDAATRQVAGLLSGPGASFTANPTSASSGAKLKSEIEQHSNAVEAWALREGFLVRSGPGNWAGLLFLGALVVSGWMVFNPPVDLRGVALIPGLFALGATEVMGVGAQTKRTSRGRDLWSRLGGFRRVLSTPSSVDRFDFSGREDLYTAYLPWAVAFGCAQEWADKYRTEIGSEPPMPPYIGGYGGGYIGGDPTAGMVDDFSSTVSSAISSYAATQRSSSSGGGGGGGGFSGGGGGGGGGGGSW